MLILPFDRLLMTLVMFDILMTLVINICQAIDRKSDGEASDAGFERKGGAQSRRNPDFGRAPVPRSTASARPASTRSPKTAGLTHGGLYSQFGSKEAIAAEAIRFALARSKRVWRRAAQGKPGSKALLRHRGVLPVASAS